MIPNLDLSERLLGEVCTTVQLYCQNFSNLFAAQVDVGPNRSFLKFEFLK